jgi:DUF4097 and DUF4098 domain-containing protein YvlB
VKTLFVLGFVGLAACVFFQKAQAWPAVRSVDTTSYNLANDSSIAVDDSSGDVHIVGWNSDRIQVTTTKTSWSDDDLRRLGTRIDAHPDRFSIAAVYPSHCLNCDVSLKIWVPSRAHVTIETSSGDVTVESLGGPARVDSSIGDVTLKDVAGEVHVHASSGAVTLDGISSSADVFASSGDIEAKRLVADVNLVTSSGSVTAAFARFDAVRSVRMESTSGDISLTVPHGAGFKIQATTRSGSIDSNLDLPVREHDSGADVWAQVGDGKASVQMSASSGDIEVKTR